MRGRAAPAVWLLIALGLALPAPEATAADDEGLVAQCRIGLSQVTGGSAADPLAMAGWIKTHCSAEEYTQAVDSIAERASDAALVDTQSREAGAVAGAKAGVASAQAAESEQLTSAASSYLGATSTGGGASGGVGVGQANAATCQQLLANANQCRANGSNIASLGATTTGQSRPSGQAGAFSDCYNLNMNAYHAERCG